MAWEFLDPILTDVALRSIQADASPLLSLLLAIIGIIVLCVLIWYIHFVTEKSYPKKKDANAKKIGFIERMRRRI